MSNLGRGQYKLVTGLSDVIAKCFRLSVSGALPPNKRQRLLLSGKRLRIISEALRGGTGQLISTINLKKINNQLKQDLDGLDSAEAAASIEEIISKLDLLVNSDEPSRHP